MQTNDHPTEKVPGDIVAEFDCGADALAFRRMKGDAFVLTPGIHRVYAVRHLIDVPLRDAAA